MNVFKMLVSNTLPDSKVNIIMSTLIQRNLQSIFKTFTKIWVSCTRGIIKMILNDCIAKREEFAENISYFGER